MLLKKIINEIKVWHIVRKTVKSNINRFYELNFDCDWLGRVYTIINIPDEIINIPVSTRKDIIMKNIMIDEYIKNSLGDITDLFTELQLSDLIVYPSVYERFDKTDSILLILAPDRKYTRLWVLLSYLIGVTLAISVICLFVKYFITLI